jgi:alkylhydroperoxidase family enzyme
VLGESLIQAVLDDWNTAPVDEKLRAMLGFLEKLTLFPDDVTPSDVDAVRAAGVQDEAIEDAIYVCAAFSMIDRIADALGFKIPGPKNMAKNAKILLDRGYVL